MAGGLREPFEAWAQSPTAPRSRTSLFDDKLLAEKERAGVEIARSLGLKS